MAVFEVSPGIRMDDGIGNKIYTTPSKRKYGLFKRYTQQMKGGK